MFTGKTDLIWTKVIFFLKNKLLSYFINYLLAAKIELKGKDQRQKK